MTLRVLAPAKVNLYLAVGPAAPDGYHPVDTVMHAIGLHDRLRFDPAPSFSFACDADLGLPEDGNLAVRAARAMAERFGRRLEVRLTLEKSIPAGAGLGGASADAAGVIAALATLWGVEDRGALHEVARALGADVPFFLDGGAARFTGRGDVFDRRLPGLDTPVVLVKPAEPVPTAEAYRAFDELPPVAAPPVGPLIDALVQADAVAVAGLLHNAMTRSSVALVPAIADALRLVAACPGVIGAAMAGSGSAVFGLCVDDAAAASCARRATREGLWARATRLQPSGADISKV